MTTFLITYCSFNIETKSKSKQIFLIRTTESGLPSMSKLELEKALTPQLSRKKSSSSSSHLSDLPILLLTDLSKVSGLTLQNTAQVLAHVQQHGLPADQEESQPPSAPSVSSERNNSLPNSLSPRTKTATSPTLSATSSSSSDVSAVPPIEEPAATESVEIVKTPSSESVEFEDDLDEEEAKFSAIMSRIIGDEDDSVNL
jgi:hypothetical protein